MISLVLYLTDLFTTFLQRAQYLSGTVVSALGDQHGEFLLKELVRRWSNHKIMNQWMQKFFQYLDRCGILQQTCRLTPLLRTLTGRQETSHMKTSMLRLNRGTLALAP